MYGSTWYMHWQQAASNAYSGGGGGEFNPALLPLKNINIQNHVPSTRICQAVSPSRSPITHRERMQLHTHDNDPAQISTLGVSHQVTKLIAKMLKKFLALIQKPSNLAYAVVTWISRACSMGLVCTCSLYVYTTVSLPSTLLAQSCLTSVFKEELVNPTWQGPWPDNLKLAIEEDRSSNCVRLLFWSLVISDILPLQN